jgi:hypothetical protein
MDDQLGTHTVPRDLIAVRGELIEFSSLPSTSYSGDGDKREATYCPACLYVATEHNRAAGLDVGCPPGITVIMGTWPGVRR